MDLMVFDEKCDQGRLRPVLDAPSDPFDENVQQNRRLREELKRLQEELERERAEGRGRLDELGARFAAERAELLEAASKELARGNSLALELIGLKKLAREERANLNLHHAIRERELLSRNRQLENRKEDLQRRLDAEKEMRVDLQRKLSVAQSLSETMEGELEEAGVQVSSLNGLLAERDQQMQKAFRDATEAIKRAGDLERCMEDLVVEAKQGEKMTEARVREARREVVELLVPILDLIRYARAAFDPDHKHSLLQEAICRFQDLGLQCGRPPEETLTASECAKLLSVSKRKLREIPRCKLPYEIAGDGKVRQHRLYLVRDCMTYVAISENSGS